MEEFIEELFSDCEWLKESKEDMMILKKKLNMIFLKKSLQILLNQKQSLKKLNKLKKTLQEPLKECLFLHG